jgi:hypothetical protein
MADYAVAANLISWVPAAHELFGWPIGGGETDLIKGMSAGDLIVPKFAQNPVAGGGPGHADYQRAICDVFDENYEEQLGVFGPEPRQRSSR